MAGIAAIVIGIIISTSFGSILGLSGAAIAIAGIFLILLVAWRSLEQWRSKITLGLTVLAAATLVLLTTERSWLFGNGKTHKDLGVVGRPVDHWVRHGLHPWVRDSALPWLRNPWWDAPAAFGLLVLVLVGLGYRLASRRRV